MHQPESFETIVRTHQGAVRTFLRRLLRNSALADELAQETFLTAYRTKETHAAVRDMRAWLLRIAYRRFLDYHRREKRRRGLSEDQHDPTATEPAHPGTRLDVTAAMNTLSPERRACAMLCLAQDYSHADAAHITGMPLGTVKSHVNRARSTLQTLLKDYQGASS